MALNPNSPALLRQARDGAIAVTRCLLEDFPELLAGRNEARVFHDVFVRVKAGLEATLILADRERRRLNPLPGPN